MLDEPQAEPDHISKTRMLVEQFMMEDRQLTDVHKPFKAKSIMPASEFGESQFQSPYHR